MTTVRITDAGGNKPSFVQWDVDRVLYVSGVASQPCLHFANAELKRAIVVQATDDNGRWKCLVPNFILQFACPMVVSVFVQPDEGRTVATAVYEVKPKLKPQDYSYTENIGYINWVQKSEEIQDLIDTIQGMLDRGELKGDPFTYDDFTEEQLETLKGDSGDDGVSPTVSTEVTYYGNKVTFTDADGDHTINVLNGMTATVKSALLDLFQHVAYVDGNGQQYYDALYDAFNPVLNVECITVAFDPGTAVIYNTYELAQLKPYLTVTAHFDDDTTAVVNDYTLSGTLATGTSAITATYGGKSAIFTVNVVEWLTSITAVFNPESANIYDTYTLDALKQYLTVTANYADSTSATVTDYTLSGDLEAGTSAVTASYGGKTATFNVTVTSRIPSAYRQVEYLQSDLTQAIQTNIAARNTRTLCTFQYVAMRTDNGNSFVTGGFNTNQRYLAIQVVPDHVFEFIDRNGTSKWKDNTTNPTVDVLEKHTFDFNNATHQAIIDGSVKATADTFACTSGDWVIAIFCRGRDNTSTFLTNTSSSRIFSLLYEDNDTGLAVGEFIPCYRKSDNVGGMYDLVSQQFYTDVLNGNPFAWGAEHWESGT